MLVGPGMPGRMPSHARLGITICNQPEADRDISKLLALGCPNFLSIEPMLGPVDLTAIRVPLAGESYTEGNVLAHKDSLNLGAPRAAIDWVICGGESGPQARPMHPDWVRSLRDQCAAAGVPFHFKQWGEWTPGENVERQRGTVDTAFLWDDGWHVYPLNLATDHGHIDDQPDLYRVGAKAAGRLLDGRTHDEFPP
jgi:protein gp37